MEQRKKNEDKPSLRRHRPHINELFRNVESYSKPRHVRISMLPRTVVGRHAFVQYTVGGTFPEVAFCGQLVRDLLFVPRQKRKTFYPASIELYRNPEVDRVF